MSSNAPDEKAGSKRNRPFLMSGLVGLAVILMSLLLMTIAFCLTHTPREAP